MSSLLALVLASSLIVTPLFTQFRPTTTAGDFEEPPTLNASEILRPEPGYGSYHAGAEAVPTYAGHNEYLIESDFGILNATGKRELMICVWEIAAIAKLREAYVARHHCE